MTSPDQTKKSSRIRASESALRIALKALKAEGIPIHKVVVLGGQIEIHCAASPEVALVEEDSGLEKW